MSGGAGWGHARVRQEPEEKAEVEQAYYHKTREERVGIRLHTIVGKESMHLPVSYFSYVAW